MPWYCATVRMLYWPYAVFLDNDEGLPAVKEALLLSSACRFLSCTWTCHLSVAA